VENNTKIKILIVEDESHIAEGIKLNLDLKGYETMIAKDGRLALEMWKSFNPDLIVLDLMLPFIDGFGVLKEIRNETETLPIIILSARYEAKDKINCFENGVDDYLCKPFNLEEFLLRVNRLVKRAKWNTDNNDGTGTGDTRLDQNLREYTFGSNRINFELNEAYNGQETLSLTVQEVKLLKLFISNKEIPLSRQVLLETALGYQNQETVSTRTIDNFIVRFRKYFEVDSKSPMHFKSLRSVGYIFYP